MQARAQTSTSFPGELIAGAWRVAMFGASARSDLLGHAKVVGVGLPTRAIGGTGLRLLRLRTDLAFDDVPLDLDVQGR